MVIQGSINSLLQTAGIASRLSPLYEKQVEKQQFKREGKQLEAEEKGLNEAIEKIQNLPQVKNLSPQQQAEQEELAVGELGERLREVQLKRAVRGEQDVGEAFLTGDMLAAYRGEGVYGETSTPQKPLSYEEQINKRVEAMRAQELALSTRQNEIRNGRRK